MSGALDAWGALSADTSADSWSSEDARVLPETLVGAMSGALDAWGASSTDTSTDTSADTSTDTSTDSWSSEDAKKLPETLVDAMSGALDAWAPTTPDVKGVLKRLSVLKDKSTFENMVEKSTSFSLEIGDIDGVDDETAKLVSTCRKRARLLKVSKPTMDILKSLK